MLRVNDLTIIFNKTTILSRISFELQEGEVLGITGPAGCGKTSLLKAACGRIKTQDNIIVISGKCINKYRSRELRRLVEFLPYTGEYNPESTVFEEVIKGRLHLKKTLNPYSEIDHESTLLILQEMGINVDSGKRLKNASDSLKRITLIARALNSSKKITVYDSPEAGLDPAGKIAAVRAIKKSAADGDKSVIIASSDPDFLIKTCDRIIFLKDGSIADQGSADILTEELIKKVYGINTLVSKNIVTGLPEIHVIDMN